jgi:hypothetical protein
MKDYGNLIFVKKRLVLKDKALVYFFSIALKVFQTSILGWITIWQYG